MSDSAALGHCCERFVSQVGVVSPATCPDCGTRLMVRDRRWIALAATVSPADIIRRTLSAVVLQAGSVSVTDAHEALDALVADLANALHGRELARLDTERERSEAERYRAALERIYQQGRGPHVAIAREALNG